MTILCTFRFQCDRRWEDLAMIAGKPEIRKMPFDLEMDAFDGAPVEDDQAAAREALESLNNSKTR